MTEAEIEETQQRVGPEKMGPGARKRRLTKTQTTIMLDQAERDALDVLADGAGRSRSDMIREAVRKVWLKGKRP